MLVIASFAAELCSRWILSKSPVNYCYRSLHSGQQKLSIDADFPPSAHDQIQTVFISAVFKNTSISASVKGAAAASLLLGGREVRVFDCRIQFHVGQSASFQLIQHVSALRLQNSNVEMSASSNVVMGISSSATKVNISESYIESDFQAQASGSGLFGCVSGLFSTFRSQLSTSIVISGGEAENNGCLFQCSQSLEIEFVLSAISGRIEAANNGKTGAIVYETQNNQVIKFTKSTYCIQGNYLSLCGSQCSVQTDGIEAGVLKITIYSIPASYFANVLDGKNYNNSKFEFSSAMQATNKNSFSIFEGHKQFTMIQIGGTYNTEQRDVKASLILNEAMNPVIMSCISVDLFVNLLKQSSGISFIANKTASVKLVGVSVKVIFDLASTGSFIGLIGEIKPQSKIQIIDSKITGQFISIQSFCSAMINIVGGSSEIVISRVFMMLDRFQTIENCSLLFISGQAKSVVTAKSLEIKATIELQKSIGSQPCQFGGNISKQSLTFEDAKFDITANFNNGYSKSGILIGQVIECTVSTTHSSISMELKASGSQLGVIGNISQSTITMDSTKVDKLNVQSSGTIKQSGLFGVMNESNIVVNGFMKVAIDILGTEFVGTFAEITKGSITLNKVGLTGKIKANNNLGALIGITYGTTVFITGYVADASVDGSKDAAIVIGTMVDGGKVSIEHSQCDGVIQGTFAGQRGTDGYSVGVIGWSWADLTVSNLTIGGNSGLKLYTFDLSGLVIAQICTKTGTSLASISSVKVTADAMFSNNRQGLLVGTLSGDATVTATDVDFQQTVQAGAKKAVFGPTKDGSRAPKVSAIQVRVQAQCTDPKFEGTLLPGKPEGAEMCRR